MRLLTGEGVLAYGMLFRVCVCVCVCATQVLTSQSSTVFFFIALEICSDERSPRFRLSCDFVASHAAKVCQFAA